jgi:hypothetical protein
MSGEVGESGRRREGRSTTSVAKECGFEGELLGGVMQDEVFIEASDLVIEINLESNIRTRDVTRANAK